MSVFLVVGGKGETPWTYMQKKKNFVRQRKIFFKIRRKLTNKSMGGGVDTRTLGARPLKKKFCVSSLCNIIYNLQVKATKYV